MADSKVEKNINDYPEAISLKGTEELVEQMKKKVCKIIIGNEVKGTGFFCKTRFNNNELILLITTNQIINESILYKGKEKISLSINNDAEKREIELENRIKYTKEENNITIIEIKEEDNINNFF